MCFLIDAKSVVWENRVYTIMGYQVHNKRKYAEAVYNKGGVLVNVNADDLELRENLIKRLEHRI